MSGQIERIANFRDVQIDVSVDNTASGAFTTEGFAIGHVKVPSTMTDTTLSFQGSHDGTTFAAIRDEFNTLLSITFTAGAWHAIPGKAMGFKEMKLVSGGAEAADRDFVVQLES